MRVAVIGLGKMGLPIARNLLERGFEVTGYRRSPGTELVDAGGQRASSAADAAADADVIISIVPDADAVDEVVLGPAGTLKTMRPGHRARRDEHDPRAEEAAGQGRGAGGRRRPA